MKNAQEISKSTTERVVGVEWQITEHTGRNKYEVMFRKGNVRFNMRIWRQFEGEDEIDWDKVYEDEMRMVFGSDDSNEDTE